MKTAILNVDGSCENNGTRHAMGGWGYVLRLNGEEIATGFGPVEAETATNNTAEYEALEAGLQALLKMDVTGLVEVQSDSQLVVHQVNGDWQCTAPHLAERLGHVQRLLYQLARRGCDVFVAWIPREESPRADELAHRGLDEAKRSSE